MAGEYRATLAAAEVLGGGAALARATALAVEVQGADEAATGARVTAAGAEVSQTDDAASDIRASLAALEVLRAIADAAPGTVHFGTAVFGGDLALAFGPARRIVSGAVRFGGALRLAVAGEKFPPFDCPAPAPKAWARLRPQAKGWDCTPAPPPQPCEPAIETADDLDLVTGERLVGLGGLGLKLIG